MKNYALFMFIVGASATQNFRLLSWDFQSEYHSEGWGLNADVLLESHNYVKNGTFHIGPTSERVLVCAR
eukprot:snap_masked-scaffold_25-processed-gene-3.12-mRNA-1 protein AED:1.00 eAED:1.00 QI:0/-1/0/0/-1/1/1/0/68